MLCPIRQLVRRTPAGRHTHYYTYYTGLTGTLGLRMRYKISNQHQYDRSPHSRLISSVLRALKDGTILRPLYRNRILVRHNAVGDPSFVLHDSFNKVKVSFYKRNLKEAASKKRYFRNYIKLSAEHWIRIIYLTSFCDRVELHSIATFLEHVCVL
jgi:hypothetical protein